VKENVKLFNLPKMIEEHGNVFWNYCLTKKYPHSWKVQKAFSRIELLQDINEFKKNIFAEN